MFRFRGSHKKSQLRACLELFFIYLFIYSSRTTKTEQIIWQLFFSRVKIKICVCHVFGISLKLTSYEIEIWFERRFARTSAMKISMRNAGICSEGCDLGRYSRLIVPRPIPCASVDFQRYHKQIFFMANIAFFRSFSLLMVAGRSFQVAKARVWIRLPFQPRRSGVGTFPAARPRVVGPISSSTGGFLFQASAHKTRLQTVSIEGIRSWSRIIEIGAWPRLGNRQTARIPALAAVWISCIWLIPRSGKYAPALVITWLCTQA